ncbi:hypothetical protein [Brachybacterium sp. FME24]|uniref:hypothetical protein n=1 Tax=Brachybacterium sp. FME24 TaxID=2742605 RepID=UPI0018676E08|nr:hypothetical protein [Brachybacterium sp. FME24]
MRAIDVRSVSGEEELLTVSSKRGVIPRASATVSMFKAESYVGHKLCWPNDLVINSLWAWGRGLGIARHHGIVSTAYGVYRQRNTDLDPSYLHELVRSEPFQWELQVRSQGVWKSRLQISDERWLDAPLLVPPAEEQTAIVKYLAHANARIDKAIAAKRRLIALLEEQTSSLRHEALGESAGQWPVRRLKTLLIRVDQGVSPQAENQMPSPDDWGVLKAGCVNGGVFRPDQIKRLPDGFAVPASLRVANGDILVARASGSPNLVGSTARVTGLRGKAILSDKTFRLIVRPTVDPDFLVMAMNSYSYRQQVQGAISGAEGLANNLPVTALRSFVFPMPPLTEQREIVERVTAEAARTLDTIARVAGEAQLLQEFRTRLVADVVTGQVDIRAIAATLPDAPESFDNTVSATNDDLEEAMSEGEE